MPTFEIERGAPAFHIKKAWRPGTNIAFLLGFLSLMLLRFGVLVALAVLLLQTSRVSHAAIGPVAELEIVNAAVQPDGFRRQ